ncbi:dTDP-4-dehydrorhamnose reductase [Ichthyobacterium seriolicida]|uniref:dTDP-4-dehydrorhamnose reductase n=1 Tax=Ichthyobacterium seriolicida TaxID=242600 RepID=A0A1J1DZ24_9FLAO|nr:dTDP-4-dehydrorhamnose reductase [Ichthyobacterium seriolicida]BAV95153.1 dTDP-4-dehydrorhamnose reductase [Ichthyobacterium seriolicida]
MIHSPKEISVLIIGANGQLGSEFIKLFDKTKVNYTATKKSDLDITDQKAVIDFIGSNYFSHIINCAAYNDVDKSEINRELCSSINTKGPLHLAKISKKIGAVFITYSTNFVFDGNANSPYSESSLTSPLSFYGESKLQAEKLVLKELYECFIIRTSWVFGINGDNFNKSLIEWAKYKNEINVPCDQISSPTYAKDLAYYSWELLKTDEYGLYNLSGGGVCSKYQKAEFILNQIGWKGKLNKVSSSYFKTLAKRPRYSKISNEKIEKTLGLKIPNWKESTLDFLQNI